MVTSLTIFAGTPDGPFLSRDWGGSWQPIKKTGSKGDDPQEVGATHTFLPLGPLVYMGGEGGLYSSDDFGETWTRLELHAHVLAVLPSRYPQADPTVFVGTSEGLLESEDAGATFHATPVTGTPVNRIVWPGPALVLATGRGVLVSHDAARTLAGPGEGLPEGEVRAMALSSFFAMDPVLFAGVGNLGVYRSSDEGRTWVPAGLAGRAVTDLTWLGPFLYAATDQGFFRTQDLGKEWVPLDEGIGSRRPLRMLFPLAPDSGAEIFLGTDRGVLRSPDGGAHWLAAGLADREVLCVSTFPPAVAPTGKRRRK